MTVREQLEKKYGKASTTPSMTVRQQLEAKYKTANEPITVPPRNKLMDNLSRAGNLAADVGNIYAKAGDALISPTINAFQTGLSLPIRAAQEIIPGGKTGHEVYQTPFGENKAFSDLSTGQKIMNVVDILTAGAPVEQGVKKPLTVAAEKLYQSALKAKDVVKNGKVITQATDIAKIGLDEKVWLTKGGVEKVASKIDDFENALGTAIEQAKQKGVTISTKGLQSYLDEAKNFFANQFNVADAKKALEEIDNIGKNFVKQYGDNIPIEKAQQIKVATGQALKRYYDRMSSASIEGTKQGVRYLKDEIVKKAPQIGDINQRLSNLYQFDNALAKASTRINNLNLLGLPSKVGGAVAGTTGAVTGKLLELLDSAAIKSGTAISLDSLAKGGNAVLKGVKIPIASLLTKIVDELNRQSESK